MGGGVRVFLHVPHQVAPPLPIALRHHDAHLPFWSTWAVPAAPLSQVQMVISSVPPLLSPLPSPWSHSEQGPEQKPAPPPSTFSFQGRGSLAVREACPTSLSLPAGTEACSRGGRVEDTHSHTQLEPENGQAEDIRLIVTVIYY